MEGISSSVAQQDYLQLLTIQLTNQDPIEPMKQEEFTAQLTQMSMLEKLEGLEESFQTLTEQNEINQGIGLIGKQASYLTDGTDQVETGTVDKFIMDPSNPSVEINGERVALNLVSSIA